MVSSAAAAFSVTLDSFHQEKSFYLFFVIRTFSHALSLSHSRTHTHAHTQPHTHAHLHNLAFFPTWQITREKNTQESKNLIKSRWTFVRVEEDEEEKKSPPPWNKSNKKSQVQGWIKFSMAVVNLGRKEPLSQFIFGVCCRRRRRWLTLNKSIL